MTVRFEGKAAWVPSHADGVAMVAAVWRAASADDMRGGLRWYADARRIAGAVGRAAGFRGKRATACGAGILAALSPAFDWDASIAPAFEIANGGTVKAATGANIDKARAIADGGDPLEILSGDKVRAFYACIVAGGITDTVCIDRHAMAIVAGRKLTDGERGAIRNVGVYDAIASMYVDAAAALGVPAPVVQAVTWVVWRRWTYRRHSGFVPAELGTVL